MNKLINFKKFFIKELKKNKIDHNNIIYFFLFLFLVFLDQLTKFFIRTNYLSNSSRQFLFFNLTYVVNTGVSFGLFKGNNLLFLFLLLIAFIFFLYKLTKLKKRQFIFKIPLIFLCSGILGNLLDRIFLGYVVDFIDFNFWPVFNLADSYISISAILILYISFFKKIDLF